MCPGGKGLSPDHSLQKGSLGVHLLVPASHQEESCSSSSHSSPLLLSLVSLTPFSFSSFSSSFWSPRKLPKLNSWDGSSLSPPSSDH